MGSAHSPQAQRQPLLSNESPAAAALLGRLCFYTSGESGEVKCFRLRDLAAPALEATQCEKQAEDTTATEWIIVHSSLPRLYSFSSFWKPGSVIKISEARLGEMAVYNIGGSGDLEKHSVTCTLGRQPCEARISPDEAALAIAHYLDATISYFPLIDGYPQTAAAKLVKLGEPGIPSPVPGGERVLNGVRGSLCHGVRFSPAGNWLLGCDAGESKIYAFRRRGNELQGSDAASVTAVSSGFQGRGFTRFLFKRIGVRPRHVAFHPTGQFVFVIYEISKRITVHRFSDCTGELSEAFQNVPAVGYMPQPRCRLSCLCPAGLDVPAEIEVRPDGRMLYASVRGIFKSSALTSFSIGEDGLLSAPQERPAGGKMPRHFILHEGILIAGLESSDEISIFDARGTQLALLGVWKLPGDGKHRPQCVQVRPIESP